MVSDAPARTVVPNPRGAMSIKVDGNGRIKLPARFLEYLAQLTDKRIYATLINDSARLYMNGSWERNLDLLKPWPRKRRALDMVAARYGQDLELDDAGRITLPQALRKKLNLENQQIYFVFHDDVALIYTEAQYESAMAAAEQELAGFLDEAEDLGFV